MKRKIWRAFCSYYALHPFEKDDEVIVFFEAAAREEARETLPVNVPALAYSAGKGGLLQP